MICEALLLTIGYGLTITMPWHNGPAPTNIDSAVVSIRTCEEGLGLYGRASEAGLYEGGITYGLKKELGDFSASFAPHFGVSYTDHKIPELPLRTQFDVGASAFLGYREWRVGATYDHNSNAGLRYPNVGEDRIIVEVGRTFHLPF